MILVIDNFDSFTHNIVQYLQELKQKIIIYRNNEITLEEVLKINPKAILISPGPSNPQNAGICLSLIEKVKDKIPILGVCLGHQAIGEAFGGKIVKAPLPMHGKISKIKHERKSIFKEIENPFLATRYHSLVIDKKTFPEEQLEIIATCDNQIMGIHHKKYLIIGVQFHPESFGSTNGKKLLSNFIQLVDNHKLKVY